MATQTIDVMADPVAGRGIELSGRTVGQLGTAEQLLLWALRQRLHDGAAASPALLQGFRLAFGLSLVEPALATFEALFGILAATARNDLRFCPLRCACISADEDTILGVLAQAHCGLRATLERRIARLVHPASCVPLAVQAELLAALIERAGLAGSLN